MAELISERPWGMFVQYCQNKQATVKIITVNPGHALSVQTHEHRDELWVALDPNLVTHINGESHVFMVGEEAFIERGTIHSVENRGFEPARFLEVAFGHFDEEDIRRISDKYGRT